MISREETALRLVKAHLPRFLILAKHSFLATSFNCEFINLRTCFYRRSQNLSRMGAGTVIFEGVRRKPKRNRGPQKARSIAERESLNNFKLIQVFNGYRNRREALHASGNEGVFKNTIPMNKKHY